MRKSRYIKVLAASVALLAIFIFLNGKPTGDHNQNAQELFENNLRDMQTHHRRLALNLLRVHMGYVSHYDFIDADLSSMYESAESSPSHPKFVSNAYIQTRDGLIVEYLTKLERIEKKVNRIKSLLRLVRTSEEFSNAIHEDIRLSEPDDTIMAGLYQYQHMMDNSESAIIIRSHLEDLAALPSAFSQKISRLIPHAALLASYRPVLLELTNETNDLLIKLEEPNRLSEIYNEQRSLAATRMTHVVWVISLIGLGLVACISMLFAQQFRLRSEHINKIEAKNEQLVKALQERDEYSEQASTDPLTGLYNRRAFWRISSEYIDIGQKENRSQAMIVSDLDGFKQINDEYGHASGDLVLVTIASRLERIIGERDAAVRLGGDEFAVLVEGDSEEEVFASIARIHSELCRSVQVNNHSLRVTGSIGAVFVSSGRSVDDLLSDADMAMYHGRENKCGGINWFTDTMRSEGEALNKLSHDLEVALRQGNIEQAYQPILDLKKNVVYGLEVLARWSHPERGPIPPDVFIDIAQRRGIQADLDRYMIESALGVLRKCHQDNQLITMQVNLCALSITPDFPDFVEQQLQRYEIDPCYIVFELTETWIVNDLQQTTQIAERLVDLGVSLHLDDFGTGFSSLAHLQSLPISGLKIDRSFIAKVNVDKRSQKLVDATIALANSLDLEVVAEGIETVDQERYVCSLGCDYGQGYLYSKPVSEKEALQLVFSSEVRTKAA